MAERSFAEPIRAVDVVDKFDNIPLKPRRTLNDDYLIVVASALAGFSTAMSVIALVVSFAK